MSSQPVPCDLHAAQPQRRPRAALRLLDQARAMQDPRLAGHHRRVGAMSGMLARLAGLGEAEAAAIGEAGSSHDIGMTLLPEALMAQKGLISANERALIRRHSGWGSEMMKMVGDPALALSAQVALQHHERMDGGGYPAGLAGEEICVAARIVAICATYDALRHPRPRKAPHGHEAAMDVIRLGDEQSKPGAFDPALRDRFAANDGAFRRIAEA